MENRTCKECNCIFDDENFRNRHLKFHHTTLEKYKLKWLYGGIRPLCKCGCGEKTNWNVASKDFAVFLSGHSAWGRKKSDDEKQRIGKTNSVNMTRYMKENPEIAKAKYKQLMSGHTPEVKEQRIQATKDAYTNMPQDDLQKFSDLTKRRWQNGEMDELRVRAAETFRQRSENGEYDFTERNDKLSQVISQKYIDGDWKFTKGFHSSSKTGKDHYYRSSWELQYMQMLDNDIDVVSWESEFMYLPYLFEGATHRYVPDFHVVRTSNRHQLVEIKPQALRTTERNSLKREVAIKFCDENEWEYIQWEP